MKDTIDIECSENAGGYTWTVMANEELVATGWHHTAHEAKKEAYAVGVPTAVRWINPESISRASQKEI